MSIMNTTVKTFPRKTLPAVISLCVPSLLYAQGNPQTYQFHLEPQSMEQALLAYSDQSGVQVLFKTEDLQGLQSQGVHGEMDRDSALKKLLAGLELEYRFTAKNTLIVQKPAMKVKEVSKRSSSFAERVSAVLLSLFAASGAVAQDQSAGQSTRVLDEIIVTATKRSESMQDVPISIQAFSGDRLKESGIHEVLDLQSLAAGLQVEKIGAQMNVTMRGVGSQQHTIGGESGSAAHWDGVYISQKQQVGMGFFDVERVEVLYGPQGTLYGRNATGGAINIISKSPTEEFEGGGSVTLGSDELVETEGYVSGPIAGDRLMGRVAFKTRDHDGYTPNHFNGDAQDDGEFSALRGTLRYGPTDNFRIDLTADFGRENGIPAFVKSRGRTGAPTAVENATGAVLPSGRAIDQDGPHLNDRESWGMRVKMEWNLGEVTLSSLTAYSEFEGLLSLDFDGTSASYGFFDQTLVHSEQVSQEVTLSSSGDSAIEWIVGGYYFGGGVEGDGTTVVPTIGFISNTITDDFSTDAYAIFGEASYHMSDRLTLTLGARYSYEEKSTDGRRVVTFAGSTTETMLPEQEDSWNSFTPKVALTYLFSDEFTAYATIGKGFKAGGYNGVVPSPFGAYDPEEVTNYEIGVKSIWFDDRLRTNVAVFYMDYEDMQQFVSIPSPTVPNTFGRGVQNAATAEIYGAELDFHARLTEKVSFDGNVSYLDATYETFPNASNFGVPEDASGNRLQSAPEWAANLGASYTVPIGNWGTATLRGDWDYKGRVFFSVFEDDFVSQDSVSRFNVRLAFEDSSGRWTIAGWAKNLTDELVAGGKAEDIGAFSAGLNTYYLPPRTYGVTVDYKF